MDTNEFRGLAAAMPPQYPVSNLQSSVFRGLGQSPNSLCCLCDLCVQCVEKKNVRLMEQNMFGFNAQSA